MVAAAAVAGHTLPEASGREQREQAPRRRGGANFSAETEKYAQLAGRTRLGGNWRCTGETRMRVLFL